MGPTRMRLTKPVIAAIEGYAVAGGLELALWADLRVVAEDATLGVFCRRWGVPLIDGGTVRLPRIVGEGVAADLVLTGRPVDAAEALRIGLATRVVPSGTTREAAERLAAELAAFPQTTMRHDLASTKEQHGLDETAALANELRHGERLAGRRRPGRRPALQRGRGPARLLRLSRAGPGPGRAQAFGSKASATPRKTSLPAGSAMVIRTPSVP